MIAQIFRQFLYGLIVYGLLVFSHSAYADSYPPVKAWVIDSKVVYSPQEFCESYRFSRGFFSHDSCPDEYKPWGQNTVCRYKVGSNPCNSISYSGTHVCPHGGWFNDSSGLCINAPPCSSGQTRDSAGKCVSDCPVGQESTERIPVGWSVCDENSTSCVRDLVNYQSPDFSCDGSCRSSVLDIVSNTCSAPAGATASNPTVIACDFKTVTTGASCTGKSDFSPGAPPASSEPPVKEKGCDTGNEVKIGDKTYCMKAGKPSSGNNGGNGGNEGGNNNGNEGGNEGGNNGGNNGGSEGGNNGGNGGNGGNTGGDGDGKDGDGKDGEDEDGDDRNASGGCESFSCSGDAIDCSIAQAAWKAACIPESRKTTGGDNCDAEPTCEGDAIDCAVLKKQWENNCLFDWAKKENEFSESFNSAYTKFKDGEVELVEEIKDSKFQLKTYVSGRAACPANLKVPFFGKTIDIGGDLICSYLSFLALVLKILAWLYVGRLILSSM